MILNSEYHWSSSCLLLNVLKSARKREVLLNQAEVADAEVAVLVAVRSRKSDLDVCNSDNTPGGVTWLISDCRINQMRPVWSVMQLKLTPYVRVVVADVVWTDSITQKVKACRENFQQWVKLKPLLWQLIRFRSDRSNMWRLVRLFVVTGRS